MGSSMLREKIMREGAPALPARLANAFFENRFKMPPEQIMPKLVLAKVLIIEQREKGAPTSEREERAMQVAAIEKAIAGRITAKSPEALGKQALAASVLSAFLAGGFALVSFSAAALLGASSQLAYGAAGVAGVAGFGMLYQLMQITMGMGEPRKTAGAIYDAIHRDPLLKPMLDFINSAADSFS